MEALKQAAALALAELGPDPEAAFHGGKVTRASIDVEIGAQTELVSLRLRAGRLAWSCTCGESVCAHAHFALRFVSGQAPPMPEAVLAPIAVRSDRSSVLDLRRVMPAEASDSANTLALAEALDDIVTAIVRVGIGSSSAPSIEETLARLVQAAGTPPPLGVGRFIGRLRQAIETQDIGLAAHALHGASRLASDLREPAPSPEARAHITSWLGATPGDTRALSRASDRTLIEVAREWVHGIERAQIERRYLVDLHSGEISREERARRTSTASLGPCPRMIGVGLAEVEEGAPPRRMRILQYTTTPKVPDEAFEQLARWALRDFAQVAARYRDELLRFGALAEPFVLLGPASVSREANIALVDDEGRLLPLSDDEPGVTRRFEQITADATPSWVGGRLGARRGQLMLRPLAVGILSADKPRHERL